MFDEMSVGIHLPVGNLNVGNIDMTMREAQLDKHDLESQYGGRSISLPLPR
jgi:hypothetical protein